MKKIDLFVVGVSAAAAAAALAPPAAAGPVPVTAGPAWHSCHQGRYPALECATVKVPLDYGRPHGRKITLAISRVPATAPLQERQGVLLVNPGGPGASGVDFAGFVASGLSPKVAAEYDVIGFDPRGVGSSVPALHCDPAFFAGVRPDYVPRTKRNEQLLIGRAKAYATGCARRFGWMLPFMTTTAAARDMDSIRTALGQQKINYFGYSYGTYLGQLYGTMFPGRVRRMVLDSSVDPTGVWYQDNIAQDYAFQGRMDAFFAWIAAHDKVYRLGRTRSSVQRVWNGVREGLSGHPAAARVGPDELDDTYLQGAYLDTLWPGLASALAQYSRTGQADGLVAQYEHFGLQDENMFAVYNAVQCGDVGWPRSWAVWDRDIRRVARTAPFQAWDNAWFNAACAFWPVRAQAKPPRIDGARLPGILMLQGTLDPATPYLGAQRAREMLPTARMVVVQEGGNHGQSLSRPANACVDGYVDRYLRSGALPGGPALAGHGSASRAGADAICPSLPDPAPIGPATRAPKLPQ